MGDPTAIAREILAARKHHYECDTRHKELCAEIVAGRLSKIDHPLIHSQEIDAASKLALARLRLDVALNAADGLAVAWLERGER